MKGEFVFIVNGELKTYHDYNDIPEDFDHVIKFVPDVPPPPHTEDEHDFIDQWNGRLQYLIEKEKKKNGY